MWYAISYCLFTSENFFGISFEKQMEVVKSYAEDLMKACKLQENEKTEEYQAKLQKKVRDLNKIIEEGKQDNWYWLLMGK